MFSIGAEINDLK